MPKHTPTPTLTPTFLAREAPYHTFAHGELLPDLRLPIQRSKAGEGGWYVIIGTEAGWAEFLSQMGQPAEIWEPIHWDQDVLVGALLGVREGRGHEITITNLEVDGVMARIEVAFATPSADQTPSPWITYPFHFIRVPRIELPVGPVTFDFVAANNSTSASAGQKLASKTEDIINVDILWLSGERATYPTPTPLPPTLTPEPTPTSTPVPNLEVIATVLEVISKADTLALRIVPTEGLWQYVDLAETTSILLDDGQPATLSQLVAGATVGVIGYSSETGSIRAVHVDVLSLPTSEPGFAPYRPRNVTLSTIYDGYELPLSVDGISTTVPLSQTFNLTQTDALMQNGFVVIPAGYQNFTALYNDPQYVTYPVFISTDSILHISQLYFDRVLRSIERTHLLSELEMLDREMYALSWAQYEAMTPSTTPAEQRMANTAFRNAAYFCVALSLLDPEFTPPDAISPTVRAELSLIAATAGITVSPVLDLASVPDDEKLHIDYSQFAPSGHYAQCKGCAQDTDLLRYYQALTWHRLVTFRLAQREETRSAALIAHTLNTYSAPRILWERVYTTLGFFQGQEALLTPADYGDLLHQVWGETTDITVLADETKMDAFIQSIRALPPPENSMWVWIWDWKPGQPVERDWVFLGRPYLIDDYVFQQTAGDLVGLAENRRTLPSSIDLAAVLGSLEAYRIASQMGDTDYRNYVTQVDKVRNELAALRVSRWTEELYWNWLYVYSALIQDKNSSYPDWMHTAAWKRKELQTMFGSWTSIRHDANPIFKSVPAAEKASDKRPGWGYVEPQPEVYARLAALTRMIVDGLESRLVLSDAERSVLLELEGWLVFLQDVARRELTGQALTAEEYGQLAEYGERIEKLTWGALEGETGPQAPGPERDYDIAAVISIAATEKVRRVEAVGPIDEIYVVIERERERYLARGGMYSHYEFVLPSQEPLTDAMWREMIANERMPARPEWVGAFLK
jgi:hypothetical protein